MARIAVIPPSQATGELAAAYREVQTYMPRVGRLVQICSVWPAWIRMTGRNMLVTLEAGTLSRQQKEMLAVVTSRSGGCGY
jgi:hypothetical protein